jgi:ketosteroid isomerase-like protein
MGDQVEANLAFTQWQYELWNSDGIRAMFDHVYTPDVVYHEVQDLPGAGVFSGAAAYRARLEEVVGAFAHFQMHLRAVEGRGEYVLAAVEVRGQGAGSGAPATGPLFHVFQFSRGRISEVRAYVDAEQARREYERLTSVPGG